MVPAVVRAGRVGGVPEPVRGRRPGVRGDRARRRQDSGVAPAAVVIAGLRPPRLRQARVVCLGGRRVRGRGAGGDLPGTVAHHLRRGAVGVPHVEFELQRGLAWLPGLAAGRVVVGAAGVEAVAKAHRERVGPGAHQPLPAGCPASSARSTAPTTARPSSPTTASRCTRSGWTRPPARPTAATSPTASAAPPSPGRLSPLAVRQAGQVPRRPRPATGLATERPGCAGPPGRAALTSRPGHSPGHGARLAGRRPAGTPAAR